MGKISFTVLMTLVLSVAMFASISCNYIGILVYDSNIDFVPVPNANCTRYLPQVNIGLNLKDPAS